MPFFNQNNPPESPQLARIKDVDFVHLAKEIVGVWKRIARLLHIQEATITQIELDNKDDVYEQSYRMLTAWKNRQNNLDAPCEQLKIALCDDLVKKNSIAQQYCYQPKT